MATRIKIDQAGLPEGAAGRSRTDGLDGGELVTLTNVGAEGVTQFRLLWGPPGDTTARVTLTVTGDPDVWTFAPTPACHGTYRIALVEDGLVIEVRTFGIRTPAKRLLIPALNERASREASWLNDGDDQIELSENNALDFGAPLDAYDYAGWWRSQHELYLAVETLAVEGGGGATGPPGPEGPPGPTGATGPVGYVESFGAAPTWVVNHNLGRHPFSSTVETLGGVEIDVAVQHVTANQSVVSFDAPTAGVIKLT